MYTYTQTFYGVPLTQLYDYGVSESDNFKAMLEGLTELEDIDSVLGLDLESYFSDYEPSEEDKKLFSMFIDWIKENEKSLKDLGFSFSSNYHGGDEYPRIFGVYGGISLPDTGCMKIDTSKFILVIETERKVKELFSTIPKELIVRFSPLGQAGFWANNHSS